MARRLATRLGVPHVELDAFFWEPGWKQASDDAFLERVAAATRGDGWVACGNYRERVRDTLWTRADTLVWLDPPLRVVLRRAIVRTITRSILRTNLWGSGNREHISNLWSDKESLYKWARDTHADRRARYTECSRIRTGTT